MRVKIFCSTLLLLMLSVVVLYAQPSLPYGGLDPDVTAVTSGVSSRNLVKATISINPEHAKSILHLTINPVFNESSKATTISANVVYDIAIMNAAGTVIRTAATNQQNWQTDVRKLAAGTYIIRVTDDSDQKVVGKGRFVKL
jgi:hypothetical protein